MNSKDFYVTLPSNVKSYFTDNTVGNYRTKLSRKLVFPQGQKWYVGLAEISYTKSYYNVTKRQEIEFKTDRFVSYARQKQNFNKVVRGEA